MDINRILHAELEAYLKAFTKRQTEGDYTCSPSAIALYRFLNDNYGSYDREHPCKLETLASVLSYESRDGDKTAHDKCRAILSDIHEINNSQKWEKVICTDRKNGYWLSHDQKDIDDYLSFYVSKMCKAAGRAYAVEFKLNRNNQAKIVTNSYDPKPVTERHEQVHEVYDPGERKLRQGTIFGDGWMI